MYELILNGKVSKISAEIAQKMVGHLDIPAEGIKVEAKTECIADPGFKARAGVALIRPICD